MVHPCPTGTEAPMLSCTMYLFGWLFICAVQLLQSCLTPWTITHQAHLFIGFSRQEYWSGLLCPPPGDLPCPGIKAYLLCLLHWQVGSLPLAPPGKPVLYEVSANTIHFQDGFPRRLGGWCWLLAGNLSEVVGYSSAHIYLQLGLSLATWASSQHGSWISGAILPSQWIL